MNLPRAVPFVSLLLVAVVACMSSVAPLTQTPVLAPSVESSSATTAVGEAPIPSDTPAPPAGLPTVNRFRVAVIVDTLSEPVRREQAQAVFGEADKLLSQLIPFNLEMADFIDDNGSGSTNDMANRYISSHATALPNGIVIFSFGDAGQAKLYGGYSYSLSAPAGFQNTFVSPEVGANQIYVAVVHFSHKYAACGYGGSDTVQSPTSLDGECRNQSGTACVQQNGYSMCANAVGNLYMSTPTYFVSSTIIHELLHPFAPGGDKDHYSTPECNSRMGYPAGFFDLQESEYYNDLCPFVYENFVNSYQP